MQQASKHHQTRFCTGTELKKEQQLAFWRNFFIFGGHFGANFGFIPGHLLVFLAASFVTLAHFYAFLALPNVKVSKKPHNVHKNGLNTCVLAQLVPKRQRNTFWAHFTRFFGPNFFGPKIAHF